MACRSSSRWRFGVYDDEHEDCGSDVAVGLNFSATFKPPISSSPACSASSASIDYDPVAVLVHLACPADAVHRSRQGRAGAPGGGRTTHSAWRCARSRGTGRRRRSPPAARSASSNARWRRCARSGIGRVSIKDAAYEWMETAYLKASADNTLPANARQIMYALRPLRAGGDRPVLGRLELLHPDPAARLHERVRRPTTGTSCSTPAATSRSPTTAHASTWGRSTCARYLASRPQDAEDLDPASLIATSFPTAGPDNRFRFALFIEKEGFDPLLKAARIAERFDIAVMSTKGMSVTAARMLVEQLSERGVTFLVAHDFDKAGLSILETLRSDTRRYQFETEPNVVDIGLRLSRRRGDGAPERAGGLRQGHRSARQPVRPTAPAMRRSTTSSRAGSTARMATGAVSASS